MRIIVAFPPGGATDLVARKLQHMTSAALDKQVVVDKTHRRLTALELAQALLAKRFRSVTWRSAHAPRLCFARAGPSGQSAA